MGWRTRCSPCFAGSPYATWAVRLWPVVERALQSLFCWKFVCNIRFSVYYERDSKLQSLFCWKFVCNEIKEFLEKLDYTLQSLFCWKFVCNYTRKRNILAITHCCSPCFAGSSYATAENLLRFDKYLSIWLQ